jgi:hypothetical protein
MWPVDSLATPLLFTVHGNTLYSVNNAGITSVIGTIGTTAGDVSMVDDGTYLMLVDGFKGYYYAFSGGTLTQITDGNFPSNPTTVTWQDTYFIVTDGLTNQVNLSNNGDPTTWPAVNIGFTGAAPGALQAGMADHSILCLFGGLFAEFWQDAGLADFPYVTIPGSAQEYGLAAAFSLCKYDNSLAGLFKNRMGEVNVSRLSGFRLQQISTQELTYILNREYVNVADCKGFGYMLGGHPMLQLAFPSAQKTWEFDGASGSWGERQSANGRYWGNKFASFVNRQVVSDYRNGNLYEIDDNVFTDNGEIMPMEIWSKHIWADDKYISIPQIQIDIQSGVGLTSGQGVNPQIMLSVSKDGGRTFREVAWTSMGAIGAYTQRVIWRRLGRARDWVLKLRITDPVRRIITGASAEMVGGSF